jgi:hypothetical protein
MSNKYKYTFFLNNTSKIVITDESGDDIDSISAKLRHILKSKNFSVFKTKTDMVIINPLKVDAIHVSSLGDSFKDDKLNNEITTVYEIEEPTQNEKVEYEDDTEEIEVESNLSEDIDWSDDSLIEDFSEDIETELDLKSLETEI